MSSKTDKAKGKIKQAAGEVTDNDDLRREGRVDEASGNIKGAGEGIRDKFEEGSDRVKDAIRDK